MDENMKIGLHDADMCQIRNKQFPNYALMKLSAYHKQRGDVVRWWDPQFPLESFDRVYSSKIFDFTPETPYLPPDTIRGGTGYDIHSKLPQAAENAFPDYSIYPGCDYAIGYITRGCPNRCRWCVVPEKEGGISPYREWRDLVRQDTDKLVLMDNNILASPFGIQQLAGLIKSGYRIDLNQGMDARLVTPEIAEILARLDWIRFIRFSCDQKSQIPHITHACALLQKYGKRPYNVFVYILVTKDLDDAAYRVEALKRLRGINLYAQAERNQLLGIMPNRAQLEFQQRYIYGGSWRKETWNAYCTRNNLTAWG